jgi:hypothetical protein
VEEKQESLTETTVIDLAKKIRKLNVALEKERSQNIKLSTQVEEQSKKLEEFDQSSHGNDSHHQEEQSQVRMLQDEIRTLKGKASHSQRRLDQERTVTSSLRSELLRAQRILIAELGPDLPIVKASLLSDDPNEQLPLDGVTKLHSKGQSYQNEEPRRNLKSANRVPGWKGRAQQISLLKTKVKELSEKLDRALGVPTKERKVNELHASDFDHGQEHSGSHGSEPMVKEGAQTKLLRQLEAKQRRAASALARDHAKLQDDYSSMLTVSSRHEARAKNLLSSLRDHKAKITILMEKAANDDKLVRALQEEVQILKNALMRKSVLQTNLNSPTKGSHGAGEPGGSKIIDGEASNRKDSPAVSEELIKLRELRFVLSNELREKNEMIASLQIQLVQEKHARSQWFPSKTIGQDDGAQESTQGQVVNDHRKGDSAKMGNRAPLSDKEGLQTENQRLKTKVDVLRDEVKVLKQTIQTLNQSKEREITLYCKMLDDARKTAARVVATSATSADRSKSGRRALPPTDMSSYSGSQTSSRGPSQPAQ